MDDTQNNKKELIIRISGTYGDLNLHSGSILKNNEITHKNVCRHGRMHIYALAQKLMTRDVFKNEGEHTSDN